MNRRFLVTSDGHFFKSGFGGQGLYVAPDLNLVIAWFGTHDEPGSTEMLGIARQLATSGLFWRGRTPGDGATRAAPTPVA